MYLKRLDIKGFKSFADKTTVEFLPYTNNRYSITAIVGPNGAGKSNISDAIRWVMGEQSVKTLRGKKHEDVIFGGSQSRGALSAAEVTMVLDNSDHRVLEDFAEIVITRRLYRSGESEYIINNNPVRLLDVHLLLAQAQFAQHSYGVIGQGTIDKLLTVSPAERKDFLDEASGIKEFQIKQHQAQLKLARTTENVAQAERLMQEVEPRLKLLARQVKKLEKRQEIELQLRETQEQYYVSLYTINQQELDKLTVSLQTIEQNYRQAFAELESVQNELAQLAHAATRQDIFSKLQSEYQELAREKNDLERQLAIKEGQMHAEYSKTGKHNVSWLEKKISELKSQQEALANQLKTAETAVRTAERLVAEQKDTINHLSEQRADSHLKISELERLLLQDQSEQSYRQISGLTAVQAVLENREKFGKMYGLVAELGEVEEQCRLALEVAGAAYLSAIVVVDEDVARRAVEFLRSNRLGIATFLPLNKVTGRGLDHETQLVLNEPGVVGLATELVKHDSKFEHIFSMIFGHTVVVEDLAAAKRIGIGRVRMVTLAGDLVEKKGAIKGGYKQVHRDGLGFSHKISWLVHNRADYQKQIQQEKERVQQYDREFEKLRLKLLELETQKQAAEAKQALFREESNRLARESSALEHEAALLQADPKEYGALMAALAKEKEALAARIAEKTKAMEKVSRKIDNFNHEEEEKKKRVFALQDQMQRKQQRVNDIVASRNEVKIEIAKLETKQEALGEEAFVELRLPLISLVERKVPVVAGDRIPAVLDSIQKLKYQLSLIGGIDEEVVKEYEQTEERHDFLFTQISDLRTAMTDLETMIAELDEVMKKKRAAAFKKIKKEFDRYIKVLFGGGTGDIEEIYGEEEADETSLSSPDLPLDKGGAGLPLAEGETGGGVGKRKKEKALAGIDIHISPPGKKIKNISALSGGERTLASIALICAILSYNPSPFVVLDEVEAALDETNTRRFAQILHELSAHSQFIIITHNRVTMHAADALYGVVMGTEGVSKLLSVTLEQVPKYETAA